MVEAGRVTAVIDGDIGPLRSALNEAKGHASSAASSIENDFKKGFGSGLQSSVSSITSSMGPLGSAISGVSGGLGLAATGALAGVAALGALGAASVSTAANWQSLMADVSKTTGVEGSGLDQLSSDLQRIRTETGATAEDIANATVTAGSVGIPKEELAGFTEVALQMGSAFSMSSEAAVSGISAIGNSAKESGTSWTEFATRAGSSVNVLADSMRTSESEILAGMTRLGATMGLLKPPQETIPEWMALVATVQSLGLAGDQAGEAVQDALTYAAKNASSKDLGIDVAGLLGTSSTQLQLDLRTNAPEVLQNVARAVAALPLEQQAAAMAMFGQTGSKAIALLMGDLDTTTGSFDKLGSAIDDSNKAWEDGTSLALSYGKSQDTFNAATSRLTASLDVAGQKLGTVFLPALSGVVDAMTAGVNAAVSFGEAVSGAFSDTADAITSSGQDASTWLSDITGGALGVDEMASPETKARIAAMGTDTAKTMADGVKTSDDLKKAPGDALSSSETKAAAVKSAQELAKDWVAAYGSYFEAGMAKMSDGTFQSWDALNQAKISAAFGGNGKTDFERSAYKAKTNVGIDIGFSYDLNSFQNIGKIYSSDGNLLAQNNNMPGSNEPGFKDAVRALVREAGLDANEGNLMDLVPNTGSGDVWRFKNDITIDTYLDFAENLKGEIEDTGIEIGEAFTSGMVPDADQIDARLDALRHLKLYDPAEYGRQGAEGAEDYLIALQSALDAFNAAKIAYIAEPGPDTLSDFEKTFNQLQAKADEMPITMKLKADDEEFLKVLTAYYQNGGNVDWNSLGVSNPQRYLEYAKKQLSSEVSTYAEQGRTVPEGDTLNLFTALQGWFHQNYSSLDATNRTSSAILDQAISKGGLYWDQLYAHMGLLNSDISSSGKQLASDVSQSGNQFVQQIGSSAAPVFQATDYFKLQTNVAGQNIAVIGSAAKNDGIVGGQAMASGGQTGGQAIASACVTGANAISQAAAGFNFNANPFNSLYAAPVAGINNVNPLSSSTAVKASDLGFAPGSDLNNFGGVPKGWTSAMDTAGTATTTATKSTDSLCASVSTLDRGAGLATSAVAGLSADLGGLASGLSNQFYPLAGTMGTVSQSAAQTNNLLKYTAESMDTWCEAASDFAYQQETTAGLFRQSYIGPTSGYSGNQSSAYGGWTPTTLGTNTPYSLPPVFMANEAYVASPTLAVVGDRPGGEYVVGAARFENAVGRMGRGQTINVDYHPTIQGSGLSAEELSAVLEKDRQSLIEEISRAAGGF